MVGQLDGVDELARGFETVSVNEFQQQGHQVDFIDPGGTDVGRLGRNAMQEGIQAILGDGANGNEILAESATLFGETDEGPSYILFCDELGIDEQIA